MEWAHRIRLIYLTLLLGSFLAMAQDDVPRSRKSGPTVPYEQARPLQKAAHGRRPGAPPYTQVKVSPPSRVITQGQPLEVECEVILNGSAGNALSAKLVERGSKRLIAIHKSSSEKINERRIGGYRYEPSTRMLVYLDAPPASNGKPVFVEQLPEGYTLNPRKKVFEVNSKEKGVRGDQEPPFGDQSAQYRGAHYFIHEGTPFVLTFQEGEQARYVSLLNARTGQAETRFGTRSPWKNESETISRREDWGAYISENFVRTFSIEDMIQNSRIKDNQSQTRSQATRRNEFRIGTRSEKIVRMEFSRFGHRTPNYLLALTDTGKIRIFDAAQSTGEFFWETSLQELGFSSGVILKDIGLYEFAGEPAIVAIDQFGRYIQKAKGDRTGFTQSLSQFSKESRQNHHLIDGATISDNFMLFFLFQRQFGQNRTLNLVSLKDRKTFNLGPAIENQEFQYVVTSAKHSEGSTYFAIAAGSRGSTYFFRYQSSEGKVESLFKTQFPVSDLAISEQGHHAVAISFGKLFLIETASGKVIRELKTDSDRFLGVRDLQIENGHIVLVTTEGELHFWEI